MNSLHHSYVAQTCHACGRITGGCIPNPMPPTFPPYQIPGDSDCWACRHGGGNRY